MSDLKPRKALYYDRELIESTLLECGLNWQTGNQKIKFEIAKRLSDAARQKGIDADLAYAYFVITDHFGNLHMRRMKS